ncbi:MAG: hypothetical protein ABIR71_10680 [Chthoniobacterales bacterium]
MKINFTLRSGFFNPRVFVAFVLCFVGATLAFFAFHTASAQGNLPSPEVTGQYRGLAPVVRFDVSPALRDMQVIPPGPGQLRENEDREIMPFKVRFAPEWDPAVQTTLSGKEGSGGTEISGPIVSFNAQPNSSGVSPPDPVGSVGPNHIVAMANLSFQIFNKTGTSLFGPAANNTLWAGFGGPCQTTNSGDPVVLYDKLADRWLLSQFTSGVAPFFFCVAISQTPDPTGTYFRYAIATGNNFPDYPKVGVWPNAYYVSTREFLGSTGPFQGVGAYALNRAQAVAGNPAAQVISFLAPPGATPYNLGDGLLPSDLDGPLLPPANSPNFYVGSMDNNGPYGAPQDALTLWKFTANFTNPPASSFVLANTIPVAAFNSILGICGGTRACIPQPGTANRIDHLGYRQRPTFRLAYRNFGDHESLVTNQSVSGGIGPNGEVSGIRWWEVRSPNNAPVIFQQGTFSPGVTDGIHRWMGSIAMDGEGNMGLGYSAANNAAPAVFPSVRYTGRLEGSAAGTMPLGEGSIVAGTGSQTGGGSRWGDYTSLSIDPTDDLTFWHVNEWVPATSASGWQLRVGSFKVSQSAACDTYRVLIVYSESSVAPATLRNQILAEPGVAAVDLFVARTATPTLAQLSSYDVVVAFSNTTYDDAAAMGDVLADYADTGGLVVAFNFNWYGTPFGLAGRWMTGGYTPFTFPAAPLFTDSTLGTFTDKHPLMQEVTALNGHFRHNVALAPGATQVAAWADAVPMIAVKTQAGNTGVGINNYVGDAPNDWSGQFGRVVVNAARWLRPATSVNGAITLADPTQTNRLFRSGVDSECGAPNTCSTLPGTFHYRTHSFVNTTGAPACITATLTTSCPVGTNPIFAGAYLTSFNPANICANNIGDSGSSPSTPGVPITFDFTVPTGATFVVAVSEVTANAGCSSYTLDIAGLCRVAPVPTSVVSRKLHAGVPFDINMPLVGLSGVECRQGTGASHQLRVTFASPVTVGGVSVASGDGLATATHSISGNVVTVNLAAVTDAQVLSVALINTMSGGNVGTVTIPVGILLGDTNGSRSVSSTDIGQVKAASGQAVTGANFRLDVNVSGGSISSSDISLVKSRSGMFLPP